MKKMATKSKPIEGKKTGITRHSIIKHPLSTEKALRMMESDNMLVFVVEKSAGKPDIKKEIESLFKAKVAKVNTQITPKGVKRAYVRFKDDTPAIDIATSLGLV